MACRDKKITCLGARDKKNFNQDKKISSSNVRRTSKKNILQGYISMNPQRYLGTGQVKI